VRDRAIGLQDDLPFPFADAVGHELADLVEGRGGPFAVAQQELRLEAGALGLQERQERRGGAVVPPSAGKSPDVK